jgi:predicted MFS family arabinose efflux permease
MDAGPIKLEPAVGARAGAGRIFLLLGLAGFALGANMRITDPLLPTLALEFETTVGAAAIVATVFAAAHGALQIVYGPLGDRHGKLLIVALAALATALISLLSALASSLALLASLRFAAGLASAAVVPLSLAYIGDATDYSQRHAALARYTGVILLGMIFGQVFAGFIADWWNWRAVFVLIAVAFAAAGAGLLLSNDSRDDLDRSRRPGNLLAEPLALLKRPLVRWVLLTVFIEGGIAFTTSAFIGAHLHDRFGLSLAAIGGLLAAFAAGGLAYALVTSWVLRRIGERGALALGSLTFGVCFLVMAAAPDWRWFVPALFVAGIGLMMTHNTFQAQATQMAPEARGAALSVFASALFIGQTIGFAVSSVIYDYAGATIIFLVAAIGFPAIALVFRARVVRT